MCVKENGKSVCQGKCNGKPKQACPALQLLQHAKGIVVEPVISSNNNDNGPDTPRFN